MNEAGFQSKVTKYIKKNAWGSFPYELKVSEGNTISFSKFEPQQLPALKQAKTGILHYKLTDASFGCKPFDAFVFKKSKAYVGILFNCKKQNKICYFIPIQKIIKLQKTGIRSITKDFAKLYGIEINL